MQINISTRHGHLSQSTQDKITEKVEKLLRFNDRLTATEVTVDLEHKEMPEVEFRVSVEKSEDFVATDSNESLMAAVDSCLRKTEQQLRKHKEIDWPPWGNGTTNCRRTCCRSRRHG